MGDSLVLWHYTCRHGAKGIRREGIIRPNPVSIHPLVWLTDLDAPCREGLGLTSAVLGCDRTEFRFAVDPADAVWWPRYARGLSREVRLAWESAPDVMPAHWWVSPSPVAVLTSAEAREACRVG